MQTTGYAQTAACEKPLYLSAEDALMLLDMCVTPLSAQSADTEQKEFLVMRLVAFYREFALQSAAAAMAA